MNFISDFIHHLRSAQHGRRRKSRMRLEFAVEACEPRLLLTVPGQVQLEEIQFFTTPSGTNFPIANFDAVEDADGYQFWVSYANVARVGYDTIEPQYDDNGNPVKMRVSLASVSSSGVSASRLGYQYWVWFRAFNEDGYGEWSVGRKFVIPNGERPTERPELSLGSGGNLSSPTVGYTAHSDKTRAYVTWERDPGVQVYDVIAWKNGVPVGDVYNTGINAVNVTFQDAEDGVFEFWVRARNGLGTGPWSYRAVVGIGTVPEVTAPSGNSLPARPEFTWTRGAGGQNYELWITNEATNQRVIHQTTLTQQSYTPTTDLPDGIYKVWVREITATGYKLPWSTAVRFEVGTSTRPAAPVLSHVDHLTGGTERDFKALFNWNAVAGADHYELYVANPRNGSPYDNPKNLTDTTYTTIALEPGFHYRTWVRTISGAGVASDWSDPLRISVTSDGRVRVVGT